MNKISLIVSLFFSGLGFLGTAGLVLLLHAAPSMAVADGVADPNRHQYMFLIMAYYCLPYLIFFAGALVLHFRRREKLAAWLGGLSWPD